MILKMNLGVLAGACISALGIALMLSLEACTTTKPLNATVSVSKDSSAISKDTVVHWPASFGLGRHATLEEISKLDIDVRPDGKGLPEGSGSALIGKPIYAHKCAACHGPTGIEGTIGGRLVGVSDTTKAKTIGNYWPYATTVYDYINRAMPFNKPGSLTPDEVYSLTAFLLSANKIIDSTTVLHAGNLHQVVMPAQNLFVPDDRKGGPEVR